MNKSRILTTKQVQTGLQSTFGLEVEKNLVDLTSGKLVKVPSNLLETNLRGKISLDFAATQLELATSPVSTINQALKRLASLQEQVITKLPQDSGLWPLSMPPDLPEKEQQIPIAYLDEQQYRYRLGLARHYGRIKQMMTGVHVNVSFPPALLAELFDTSKTSLSFPKFCDLLYCRVTQLFINNRWLLIYLNGASPLAERNFGWQTTQIMRSLHNSHQYGYYNDPLFLANYSSFQKYSHSLEDAVNSGLIDTAREYYGPVRLRGEQNVAYIELRGFDLDPWSKTGVSSAMLGFLNVWLLFLLDQALKMTASLSTTKLMAALQEDDKVATEAPNMQCQYYSEADELLNELQDWVRSHELPANIQHIIKQASNLFKTPEKTAAARLTNASHDHSLTEFSLTQMQSSKQK